MAEVQTHTHISEIDRVLNGAPSPRDAPVLQSWRRCVEQHGLDPTRPQPAHIVPEGILREHREQSERLIRIARSGLETLFRQVAGQNYVLLLADAQGVTVDYFGDPNFERELKAAGLHLGSDWSEELAGTCGVGSCIFTGAPITVHQTDHFDATHTPLSCTAAPIFDSRGVLSAVLDISLLRSPLPKISQNLAMQMVTASARRIELANLMAMTRTDWVLRFSTLPELLDVDPEAAIALDGSGTIIGTTHGAMRLLARIAGTDWRRPGAVVGHPIDAFFHLDVDDLPDLTRSRPTEDRVVFLRDGSALFGHAIAPQRPVLRRADQPEAPPSPLQSFGGTDPAIERLKAEAERLAVVPLPVLIHGETGTGKERLARAMHTCVPGSRPFVAVNCAAIPEARLDETLFGCATPDGPPCGPSGGPPEGPPGRPGLVAEADGGTLFLDEVGDMPLSAQARFLRLVAEGEVLPVGALRPTRVRLKVISATRRDLAAQVRDGGFREDLYFRLAGATLTLPPLRERPDFDWLLDRLLRQRAHRHPGLFRISTAARMELRARRWPGNIRELINTLDTALALSDSGLIDLEDLPRRALGAPAGAAPALVEPAEPAPDLETALAICNWNIARTARHLGVDRSTIHRRIRRAGLNRPPLSRPH